MVIKHGATRTTLLLGRFAFKFPTLNSYQNFLYGLLGNMQEQRFSGMQMPEVAPVLFALPLGLLVVMPRADVKGFDAPDRFEYLEEFQRLVEQSENRLILENIVESKVDSVGKWQGRVVAVDYGS